MKRIWSFQGAIVGVLLLGLIWKLILLEDQAFPFNADEAIVGLMGRHILDGMRPIFFYGQAYMGALDAYLVAIGFRIFGSDVWVIRLVQTLLFLGISITTIQLSLRLHDNKRAALLSALLLAIPTVNFMLYTTVSLGGYGEALLIGNLLLLTTLTLMGTTKLRRYYLIWGVLAGVGFWAFGLTVIYVFPCAVLLVASFMRNSRAGLPWKNLGVLCTGLVIGSIPLLIWVANNELGVLLQELFGSAIVGASSTNYLRAIGLHLQNFVVFGPTVILGFRAPWSTEPLALPLLPFALLFWFAVLVHIILRQRRSLGIEVLSLMGGVTLLLLVGFIVTPFGADPSGRYFLPLVIPLVILAGDFVFHPMVNLGKTARWILLAGVLGFNLCSTWQAASAQPDRISTQFDPVARVDHSQIDALIEFLESQGETRGYTNYWVAYPLAFHSDEALIFYPALPYHLDFRYTPRDNRYPEYQTMVNQSERVAFITTNHPALNEALRVSLEDLDTTWDEAIIGDYVIIYNLSERVDIQAVGQQWLSPRGKD